MAHEPGSWEAESTVPTDDLESVTYRSGVRLNDGMPDVTYAQSCWFRGHYVPHLVVRTPDGPVTIMVLPEEQVERRQEFREGGYSGTLVPARRGAIAVLARNAADVDAIARRAVAAISYIE
jgi:hypothetical protein